MVNFHKNIRANTNKKRNFNLEKHLKYIRKTIWNYQKMMLKWLVQMSSNLLITPGNFRHLHFNNCEISEFGRFGAGF